MLEVDPTRWTSKQLAVASGTGSNVAAERCGRGDQMGFTPDEAIGCAIRSAGHSVGVAIEFFRAAGQSMDAAPRAASSSAVYTQCGCAAAWRRADPKKTAAAPRPMAM